MNTCRSCGAPIEWAITDNGRKMPIDLGLHDDGRVVVVGRRAGSQLIVALTGDQLERLRADERNVVELRRSHFQTCPQANEWRSKP